MAVTQLDTENADRDLTSIVTVLTHTPNAALHTICQGYIAFGDGAKNLDGTGGAFELTITVGGQTIEPNPQTMTFSTAVRTAAWTNPFPVPANQEVILRAKSPNAGDVSVDVTAYLFDVSFLSADVTAISGDTVAADNLEAILDGTGGTGIKVNSIENTGTTTLTGAVSLGGTLGITGAVTLSSTLETGAATFASATVTGALTAGSIVNNGVFTQTGNVTLAGTYTVDGVSTHTGAVTYTGGIVGNITGNLSGSVGTLGGLAAASAAKLDDMLDGTGATLYLSNNLETDLVKIHGTAVTETAGQLAGAFTKFFDVAVPTGTVNSIPDAVAGAAGGLFIAGTNAATAITTALTSNIIGNITGNLSGSAGSVTGAVGSVTGSVGSVVGAVGSVTGAVGSVTGAVGSIGAGGIVAATFGVGAITNAAFAAGAITQVELVIDDTQPADAADATSSFWERMKYFARTGVGTNKIDFDGSTMQIYNDAAGAVLLKHTATEAGGIQTRNEVVDP